MFPDSRILFVLAAAILFAPDSHSAEIKGVISGPDGVPVAAARLGLLGDGLHAWSQADGSFVIRNATAGEQTLRAVSPDFEAVEVQVVVNQEASAVVQLRFAALRSLATNIEVVSRSQDVIEEVPGSVFAVTRAELRASKPMDANEVLRRIPGVNLREDSGLAAMRLNIGIRGLNPDRSRRVLMLEDGLPISLAPYGEPEMYYSPPIDRMDRVEVLKGSGQIVHGPQTVGGVINFVTPDPPQRFHGDFDVEGGQRGVFFAKGLLGDSTRSGSAGWLLNYLHKQGDGWRDLYFDIDDLYGKFTLKPNDRNTVTLKGGVYDERSNSTYLGLTQPMFERNPNLNAVPGDELAVQRESGSLQHTLVLSPRALLSSAVFGYHTVRNWGRQDWDRSDRGRDYLDVIGDPTIAGGAVFLRDSAGNRNREFHVGGAQTNLAAEHELFGVRNKLDAGVRYVYEQARDQRINGAGFRARAGVLRDDEERFGNAFSAYLQNRIYLGSRWIVTPGIRLEHYKQERHILRRRVDGVPTDVDVRQDNGITTAVPGLGLSFKVSENLTLFSGVHRGFAPPRTKIAITSGGENLELDAEQSWNYEAGLRWRGWKGLRGEATYFRLDFSNQILTAAESGGATTTLLNGGETLNEGFESSLRVQWDEIIDVGGWTLYSDLRHMHLSRAEFTRNELFGGNRLPYAPRNTFSFLFGARQRAGFGFQLDMSHVADQFGDNRQTVAPSADGTVGVLPAYQLFNLTADYTMQRERWSITPYFAVKNLFDELYVASRAPQGIQPGLFRQANAGIKFSF